MSDEPTFDLGEFAKDMIEGVADTVERTVEQVIPKPPVDKDVFRSTGGTLGPTHDAKLFEPLEDDSSSAPSVGASPSAAVGDFSQVVAADSDGGPGLDPNFLPGLQAEMAAAKALEDISGTDEDAVWEKIEAERPDLISAVTGVGDTVIEAAETTVDNVLELVNELSADGSSFGETPGDSSMLNWSDAEKLDGIRRTDDAGFDHLSTLDGSKDDGLVDDQWKLDGLKLDGLKLDGLKDDGLVDDQWKFDGLKDGGLADEQWKLDGLKLDGLKLDGLKDDGLVDDQWKFDGLKDGGLVDEQWKLDGLKLDGLKVDGLEAELLTPADAAVDLAAVDGFASVAHTPSAVGPIPVPYPNLGEAEVPREAPEPADVAPAAPALDVEPVQVIEFPEADIAPVEVDFNPVDEAALDAVWSGIGADAGDDAPPADDVSAEWGEG